jgi:hypothetical protein
MSLWSRVANVFHQEKLSSEIAEEMDSHIAEAVERGRDPDEARRALGRNYQQRQQKEISYEIRTVGWLELIRADILFACRQLKRNKVTSMVAILSLALAMGACIGAFRLMDALLWRPLPVFDGRDFRAGDTAPGQAIVNLAFVGTFFDAKNPIGKTFQEEENHYQVVGLVADAPYGNLRDAIVPVAYIPFHEVNAQCVAQPETQETFLVRTSGSNPLALASVLRKAIPQARAGFRVSGLRTQSELVRAQTVRERLLAMLAAFFSFVALLLAGIGLYGVLSYSLQQREREFGIRIAVGAGIGDIAWQATSRVFLMVMTGSAIGAALGMASVRSVETLLYGVKGSDPVMLAGPALVLLVIALLSALPVIARASRIDPKMMLRAE